MVPMRPLVLETLAAASRLLQSGSWQEAEAASRATLAEAPDDPDALLMLGLAVAAMGEADRAAPALMRVAEQRPGARHPCLELTTLHPALPRSLVIQQFRACLRLAPRDERLRLVFAEFLLDNGLADQAIEALEEVWDTAAMCHMRGLAQSDCNRFGAAIESFRRAVTLNPEAAASWSNLGIVLTIEGQFAEALAAHDRAVALSPAEPRLRVNRAVALLKCGGWARAWEDHDWRLDLPDAPPIDRGRLLPSLGPDQALTGMTVLVAHEGGFGDTLNFTRYLPLLAQRGARVLALVPPALARLIGSLPGVHAVLTDQRDVPPYDFVCPVVSLPRVFGTLPRTVPPVVEPRLEPGLVTSWARRLPVDGLAVGVVWAGQARPNLPDFRTLDARRSAGLAAFEPLAGIPGVRLVSLQAGPPSRQARPPGMTLIDPMPGVSDFADTAAIIVGLDAIVSVDTSVVHLAGMMGKPVFMLDRYDGCWRWLTGRRDSPWYPNLTIYRQTKAGDWREPMTEVAASLYALAMFRGSVREVAGTMREPAFA